MPKPRQSPPCPSCAAPLPATRICGRCGLASGKGDAAFAARPWRVSPGRSRPSDEDDNYAARKADKA